MRMRETRGPDEIEVALIVQSSQSISSSNKLIDNFSPSEETHTHHRIIQVRTGASYEERRGLYKYLDWIGFQPNRLLSSWVPNLSVLVTVAKLSIFVTSSTISFFFSSCGVRGTRSA